MTDEAGKAAQKLDKATARKRQAEQAVDDKLTEIARKADEAEKAKGRMTEDDNGQLVPDDSDRRVDLWGELRALLDRLDTEAADDGTEVRWYDTLTLQVRRVGHDDMPDGWKCQQLRTGRGPY